MSSTRASIEFPGLSPGMVYIMTSPAHPGELKLGKAKDEEKRKRQGKTWVPSLEVADKVPFLRAFHAETQAKKHFQSKCVGGEWFALSVEEAKVYLLKLAASEAPAREVFADYMGLAVTLGLYPLNTNKAINPAVATVLSWRLPRSKVTVRTAIGAVLSGAHCNINYHALLEKNGLLRIIADNQVVMDLSEGSRLCTYLDAVIGQGRWEQQLKDIAGFDKHEHSVNMTEWLATTHATADTKNWITSRGNSPRFS